MRKTLFSPDSRGCGQQSDRGLWELRSCFSSTFQLQRQAIALFIFFNENNISLIWFYSKDETII